MEKVVIFGTRSTAKEIYWFLKSFTDVAVVGFTVDSRFLDSESLFKLPVVPFESVEDTFPPSDHAMFIAVGFMKNNSVRRDRYVRAKERGYRLINAVSPRAVVQPDTVLGDNCMIGHYTVLSPGVRIGNNVLVGHGCLIGHDAVVADHCFLSNGVALAGDVVIESGCFLSTNATIRNNVSVGKECIIGAGAIILENVGDRSVCLGEPATLLPISSDKIPLG